MGRKIPAKRHRGVRDPLQQRRQQFLQIRDKINHPPEKIDHQDISNQMKEFIRLRNEVKQQGTAKKRKPVEDLPRNAKRPYKELPGFKLRPGENPRTFLNRVNAVTTSNLKEAQYEAKYNVDVVRTEQGEVKVQKRSEEQLLEMPSKSKGGKDKKQSRDSEGDDDDSPRGKKKAASSQGIKRRKERFDKKKLKKEKKQKIREELQKEKQEMYKRDDIKFGEVAHAPPQLKVLPRRAEKHETVARPGQKALLLHSLIDSKKDAKKLKSRDIGIKLKTGKLNLKGKRKELPMRTREAIEEEQRAVVQQYREMKKQKLEAQQKVPI